MEDLSKNSKLLRRDGRYYFRTRVPKDVIAVIGKKEIKKSLGTSELSEAKLRLSIEQLKAEEQFAKARKQKETPKQPLPALFSKTDIERKTILWHQEEIARHALDDDQYRLNNSPEERLQTIDNFRGDLAVFDGGDESQYARSIQAVIKMLFPELNSKQSPEEFRFAHSLIHQSLIEQTYIRLERFGDIYSRVPYQLFANHNNQILPAIKSQRTQLSWEALITKFKTARKSDGYTDKTIAGYKLAFDFSAELFGKNKQVDEITTEDCRTFRDKLIKLPSNAKKRYPSHTLIQAIKLHAKERTGTLSTTSVNGNLNKLSAVLNFAVREGYIRKNPCEHVPSLKNKKRKSDSRQPFSDSSLTKIFNAPIFTGCVDDEWNYKLAGSNHPRRHKFWIPLIALHTGMRLNEICQLFSSDIEQIEGTHVIHVRLDDEDIKRLKNLNSERVIPIHSQLIETGFIEYVENIKAQGHKMLFPDLPLSKQGSYSDNFSKWFTRFLTSIDVKESGACFHSFRHSFRDALREAHTPREIGAALGGWKVSEEVMDEYGAGYKIKTLNRHVQKLDYSALLPLKNLSMITK